jgi:hypothetical protein
MIFGKYFAEHVKKKKCSCVSNPNGEEGGYWSLKSKSATVSVHMNTVKYKKYFKLFKDAITTNIEKKAFVL